MTHRVTPYYGRDRIALSDKVSSQLPEFVRANYPTFVSFLEAYYEYLDTQAVDLVKTKDIDESLDEFITYFKMELANNFPVDSNKTKERFLLKHVKDQYLAKGSEASYKLLFRILFGKDVYMDYPGKRMLRISDGKWKQDVSIFVRVDAGDPKTLIGKTVDIQTSKKIYRTDIVKNVVSANRITANVEQVNIFDESQNIWEIYLDRNFYGDVIAGDTVKFGAVFQGQILPCTARLRIHEAGQGFKPGQVFQISSGEGTPLWFKVLTIYDNGGLKTIDVIKFGLHYNTDFSLTVSPTSAISNKLRKKDTSTGNVSNSFQLTPDIIGKIDVIAGGSGYTAPPTVIVGGDGTGGAAHTVIQGGIVTEIIVDNIGSGYTNAFLTIVNAPGDTTGSGAQGEPILGSVYDYYMFESTTGFNEVGYVNAGDYWDYNWSDGAYVGTVIRQFFTDSEDAAAENPAVINVSLGAVAKYPGYYKTNDGFLDDSMFIQDSRYYQAFSYVLKIDEQLETYASVVRTMLHPSGMAMFGEYSIQNFFDLNIGFSAFVKSLGVTLFSFVYPNTTNVYWDFIKDLADTTAKEDGSSGFDDSIFFKTLSKDLGTETVTPSHSNMGTLNETYWNFTKGLTETLTETEVTTLNVGLNWDNADDKPVAGHATWGTAGQVFMQFTMVVPTSDSVGIANDNVTLGGNVPITFTKYTEDTTVGSLTESGYLFKDPYDEGGYFEDLTYNAGLQQQF
jgi:hypothetical protein